MFGPIFRFELRYQLRQPLFWLTAFVLAVLTFGATTTDSVQIGGAIGNVHRNSPFVVVRMLGIMTVIASFVVVAFMGTSILRDFERSTHELVFSRPVRSRDYLLGRFLGSLLVSCLCFAFCALGIAIGSLMPWLEPERLGPFSLWPYLYSMAVLAAPNFLFLGALFFFLASRTRSMMSTYLGLIGFFVAYLISSTMLIDVESLRLAALLDPFGLAAFGIQTRYWTVVEKNTQVPALLGNILWNRLLWSALGLAILGFTVARFRYDRAAAPRRSRRRRLAEPEAPLEAPVGRPRILPVFARATAWRQFLRQLGLETRIVLRSTPFIVIVAFGILNVVGSAGFLDLLFGTAVWPVTHLMLQALESSYTFLLVIIVTFYAGEMVWRERSLKVDGIFDALPVPTWIPLLAKLLALWAVVAIFLAVGMVALMGVQLYRHYTHFELGLYAKGFVVEVVPFLLAAVLALFLQVVSNNKFVGYLLMILYLISEAVLSALHFDHHLYRYASAPDAPYSDMNGYGHFVRPLFWFYSYWALFAGLLLCLARLLWVRGTETAWRKRLALARERFRGPVRLAAPALLVAFVAAGAFIFYNTNVLNHYVPSDEARHRSAEYEKKYRQYKDLPQPRIVAVKTEVDIVPEERRIRLRGTYRLVNRGEAPIDAIHLSLPTRLKSRSLELPPSRLELDDRRLGYSIYRLEQPMAPGAEATLGFDLLVDNPGFENHGADQHIVYNGTFFINRDYLPSIGYQDGGQLQDPSDRRKEGLPALLRFPKIDDQAARRNTYIASDADWVDFETTVSTAPDQVVLAPGYLQREWTEGGRHYFHYKMDAPILNLWGYLSARYAVRRDRWNDVALEIYYQPGHEYNLDRMMDGMKKTLLYMTENFSPYQHRQLRILEFPRYARFAQSLPNTIPFSESIGFIARLKDDDAIDYPFYVTAHEVAHQWWAHQVIGGNVQGCTMLSETMAQYSALMVMEKEYGPQKMRRFLKYELDAYLGQRGGELMEEMPLELVENQPYVHYRKGSVVLYSLKDAIGEKPLNEALRRYVAAVKFQPPPYTISRELLGYVRQVTPADKQRLLDDLFANITLFENEATEASARKLPDGRYEVTLKAKARKVRASGQGVETPVDLDDWIDIGVFADAEVPGRKKKDERVLYLQKQHVTGPEVTVTVTVDGRPARAGIDPYNKLVDRNSGDNVKTVTVSGS